MRTLHVRWRLVAAFVGAACVAALSPSNARAQPSRRWSALRISAANVAGVVQPALDTRAESSLVERAFALRAPDLSAQARQGLQVGLQDAYRELLARYEAAPPSVFARSFLAMHDEEGFDAVRVRPSEAALAAQRSGVVFLHGNGGNTTLMCELVARAAAGAGAVTICPTVDADGAWASARGRRIIELSIAHLRGLGVSSIVLAGLSNGANGVVAHQRALRSELAGLVLLSGGLRGRTRLPAMVVHGRADRMARPAGAVGFSRRSPHATLLMLPGNHFAVLHERRQVFLRLRDWLGTTLASRRR